MPQEGKLLHYTREWAFPKNIPYLQNIVFSTMGVKEGETLAPFSKINNRRPEGHMTSCIEPYDRAFGTHHRGNQLEIYEWMQKEETKEGEIEESREMLRQVET